MRIDKEMQENRIKSSDRYEERDKKEKEIKRMDFLVAMDWLHCRGEKKILGKR